MTRTQGRYLRIVLVIGTAAAGGAEGQLTRLAAELAARGHDVRVCFLVDGGPLTEVLDDAGVPWTVFGAIKPENPRSRKVKELLHFARHVRKARPDVVYAWLPGVTWVALPAVAAVSRARRIVAFRGLVQTFEVRSSLRRWVFGWAVRRAHAVTANAPWLIDEAVRWGARPARVHFMANGVALPDAVADVGVEPPTAVVLANFFAYKRHELVVRALPKVPNARVVFIGSGEMLDQTKQLARYMGVAARTSFIDDCHDASSHLANAQFAIHPSSTEGMSNAILEELAHGLPVIATDVGATSLLVDDGSNGYLISPDDLGALSDTMARLAGSVELRRKMATSSRSKAAGFSWDAAVTRHEDLFHVLTRGRR